MRNTNNFDEDQERELIHDISNALNYVGAYDALHKLLVDRYEVLLHTDMENLAEELEQFIYNWTKTDDDD